MIDHLRKIEAAAYPEYMQQMGDVERLGDIADYCECGIDDLVILHGPTWYFLAADHGKELECVDIAKMPGTEFGWGEVMDWIEEWEGVVMYGDCRKHMIPILQRVAEKLGQGRVLVLGDQWEWGEEVMTEWIIERQSPA